MAGVGGDAAGTNPTADQVAGGTEVAGDHRAVLERRGALNRRLAESRFFDTLQP